MCVCLRLKHIATYNRELEQSSQSQKHLSESGILRKREKETKKFIQSNIGNDHSSIYQYYIHTGTHQTTRPKQIM